MAGLLGTKKPADLVRSIEKLAEPGIAIFLAARLDELLTQLLQKHLPHLTRQDHKMLFGVASPLHNFAVKIALAHAIGIISVELRTDLDGMRNIRNAFAHSTDILHLDSFKIIAILKKNFSDYEKAPTTPLMFYIEKFVESRDALEESLKARLLIETLRDSQA